MATEKTGSIRRLRVVLCEVVRPLHAFKNTKQLIAVIHQVLGAYRCAHESAQILHRDISARNIMITDHEGNGILIDLDLAENVGNPLGRIGTWQFMAARLLENPEKYLAPNYTDGLESFWHILLYITLRHCDHVQNPERILSVLDNLFEFRYQDQGKMAGGDNKAYELLTQMELKRMGIRSPPLFGVLEQSAKILSVRYLCDLRVKAHIEEITKINAEYEGDDLPMHLFELGGRDLFQTYPYWEQAQKLEISGWMEELFSAVLKDPNSDWELGGAPQMRKETFQWLRQIFRYT